MGRGAYKDVPRELLEAEKTTGKLPSGVIIFPLEAGLKNIRGL